MVKLQEWGYKASSASQGGELRIRNIVTLNIVFIGIGMKEDKIEALMDSCLLTDEEMVLYQSQADKAPPDVVKLDFASHTPKSV